MENKVSQVSYYEIYLQDLSHPYIELELLGVANNLQQAQTCVMLLREALLTAPRRNVDSHRNLSKCTVMFRPVLKEN